ncbi:hypothetical protein ACMWZZ_000937 [Klebsiella oxytoca]|uniref:hypothetical protein n=1 Tax=Enterobacteriaceae TaxID=543 RepID=UPI0012DCC42C|nr:hypothetical protein [Klebsiella aerogenes]ELA2604304.1 hypothetical protein [Klebsiella aerogenes]
MKSLVIINIDIRNALMTCCGERYSNEMLFAASVKLNDLGFNAAALSSTAAYSASEPLLISNRLA